MSDKSRYPYRALLVVGLVLGLAGAGLASVPGHAPPPSRALSLSELKPIALPDVVPGEEIVMKGTVRTSFDGTVYDAISRTDTTPGGPVTRRGGLFEPETTGFRVASQDPTTHEVHLVATGTGGEACLALGMAAPCLIPRVSEAAHERLLSEAELRATLVGQVTAALPEGPPPAVPTSRVAGGMVGIAGLVLALTGLVAYLAQKRQSPMTAVKKAADKARSEIRGDRAFDTLRVKIDDLVHHAEKLERVRETTEARLAKLDVRALERKTRELANRGAAEDVRAWAEKELDEALTLKKDHEKSVHGLERVVSALGVVALSSREERGVRVDDAVKDALAEVSDELSLREEALREAEEATASLPKARKLG
jgi:hypothetical protein